MRVLLLLLIVSGCAARAADIHLSPAGSDSSGAGTLAAPYRSLGHVLEPALGLVADGDRLILHAPPGNEVYRETEVRLRRRLTLMAAEGQFPRIECPLEIEDGVCVQIDPDASGSRIIGLDIAGGQLYGIFLQTDWDARDAPQGRGASDVLLESCKVHDSGRDAIKVTPRSNNLTIRNCEIYRTGRIYAAGTPLEERNAEGIDNVGGHRMTVQDSHIHDTSTTGIYFKGGASDVLIERNRVERTGEGGILVGFDTSPEFFDLAANPEYYEALRGVVRNNIVRDTDYAGIGLFASRDALVAHNTLVNTGRLGQAALYFGVTLQDFDPVAGRPANTANRLVNNLIVQPDSGGQHDCVAIRHSQDLGGLDGLRGPAGLAGNLYSRQGGCIFRDARPASALPQGLNLPAWMAALNTDTGSFSAVVSLRADGHLLAGSAAIDRGQADIAVSDDIDRQTRRAPVDIGADEFEGTASSSNRVIDGSLSGSWFNPQRSGEGFVLEVGRAGGQRVLIASWYTYRDGQQLWLYGSTPLAADARSAVVPMVVTRGARFGSAFNAADVIVQAWGSLEFGFSDCATAHVRYQQSGGEAGLLQLTRILDGIDGLACAP